MSETSETRAMAEAITTTEEFAEDVVAAARLRLLVRSAEVIALAAPPPDPELFPLWIEELRLNTGALYVYALNEISPYILERFYYEGCVPSLEGVLRHCESGSWGRDSRPPQ